MGADPDPEVRKEARKEAAWMAAARKEEKERIEEERTQALRELMGHYQVDDLVAETGGPRSEKKKERRTKEEEKTKAKKRGTGKPAFPQATAGDQKKESDAVSFRRRLGKSVQSAEVFLAAVC
jgi:hypothetical protein